MKQDEIVEKTLESLTRIEAKVDTMNGNQLKIQYALIGIIASVIGVQFVPHSPIEWMVDFDNTTRMLAIFAFTFLAIMTWKAWRAQMFAKTEPKFLIAGILTLCLAFTISAVGHFGSFDTVTTFTIVTPFRIAYSILFSVYAWCLIPNGAPRRKRC